jgi:hypothetical protein
MARHNKRRPPRPRCRNCGLLRLPEETGRVPGLRLNAEQRMFVRGLCPSCLEADRRERRRRTGARILSKAKDAGTVERDGQVFRVVQLPPKRRHR